MVEALSTGDRSSRKLRSGLDGRSTNIRVTITSLWWSCRCGSLIVRKLAVTISSGCGEIAHALWRWATHRVLLRWRCLTLHRGTVSWLRSRSLSIDRDSERWLRCPCRCLMLTVDRSRLGSLHSWLAMDGVILNAGPLFLSGHVVDGGNVAALLWVSKCLEWYWIALMAYTFVDRNWFFVFLVRVDGVRLGRVVGKALRLILEEVFRATLG
jgi:hypothetical protein